MNTRQKSIPSELKRLLLYSLGAVILIYCSVQISSALMVEWESPHSSAFPVYAQIPILLFFLGVVYYKFSPAVRENGKKDGGMEWILPHAEIGFAIIDKTGVILQASDTLKELFGYTDDELDGKEITSLIREKGRQGLLAGIKELSQVADGEKAVRTMKVEGICKSWSRINLEIKLAPAHGMGPEKLLVLFKDVSRENKLERELSRLQGALDNSDEMVIIADEEGIVEYVNAAAAHINGADGHSLKGTKLKANLSVGDNEGENRGMWSTVQIGRTWKSEIAHHGDNGELRFEEVFVYPVKDGEEKITNYMAVRRDITGRKHTEQLISNLTRAIEYSADMIMVTDSTGKIEYVNPSVVDILGYEREEIIGKNPGLFSSGRHDPAFYEAMWGQITSGKVWSGRITNKTKSGRFVEEEISISPVFSEYGKLVNYVAVARDITKKIENEMELQARRKEAEISNHFKDELISIVSHDLKNPIIAALGLVKLVQNDQKRELDPFHHDILSRVSSSGEKALEMIEKLLLMSPSRFGKWKLEKRYFNVYALVDEVVDELETPALAKGITMENELSKDFRFHADYDLMYEVVSNLLMNAIKFTPRGGKVTVSLSSELKNTIEIRDTGRGVPKSLAGEIFSKANVTTTLGTEGEKGYGMGLPFCYEVMEKHEGSISYKSSPGKGSVFSLYLPPSKPLVMLVDDDEDFRILLRNLLEEMDVETMEAVNGSQALEMIGNSTPCLLITDLFMDPMNGFDLLKELKKRNCHIAKIAITSDTQIDTRSKAFASGAQDFVTKPLVAYDFIPRVRRLLEVEIR